MGEIQEKEASDEQKNAAVADAAQASLVVGKIPEQRGMWSALESIRTCDKVRNGVLVIFSPECSGRLGVFCNSVLTGAVVDSTGEKGIPGIRELLAVKAGMFCFRPCFGDETSELGQRISVAISELLDLVEEHDKEDPADTLSKIPLSHIQEALGEEFLGSVEEIPVESTLVVSAKSVEPAKSEAAPKADRDKESPAADTEDYFDWLGQPPEKNADAPNLRKILLPVLKITNENADPSAQVSRDLALYKRVLQQEEERVRKDIERTLEKANSDIAAKQTLDDMQMLAGMLQQQEEMISKRWEGLDQIPTPKVTKEIHLDSSGQFKSGAPVRSSKEFLTGCEDLINSAVRPVDPNQFLRKGPIDSDVSAQHFWLNHPRLIVVAVFVIVMLTCYGVSNHVNNSQVNTYLSEGREHIKAERWSEAILTLNDALAKDPACGQAYFYRGIAMEESGDSGQAAKDFQAARAHGISAAHIALAQAGTEIRKEDWKAALAICDNAIKGGVRNASLFRLRANAHLHLRNYAEAKVDCDDALKLVGNDQKLKAQILGDRGYARIQQNDFTGGAEDFTASLKENADKSLYILKGDAYRKVKKYPDAIEAYSKAVSLDPNNYDAYVARGIAESAAGQSQNALKDFGRALQLKPNGVEALIRRGTLQLAVGSPRLAIDDLQLAFDLNPTIMETRQKLMQAYGRTKGNVPKAVLAANRSASGTSANLPSDPQQLVILGYNNLNQGDYDGAIACLTQAIKKSPNNPLAVRYLAHAYTRAGDPQSAVTHFRKLAGLQGRLSDEDAVGYADALIANSNFATALDVLNRSLAGNPNNGALRLKLAETYYAAGQPQHGYQIAQDGLSRVTSASERERLFDLMQGRAAGGSSASRPTTSQPKTNIPIGSHG